MTFPRFGFGAIVTEDPTLPFTRSKDFLQLLDICTQDFGIGYLDTAQARIKIEVGCQGSSGAWSTFSVKILFTYSTSSSRSTVPSSSKCKSNLVLSK